jgi:hypothetical protein
VRSTLSAFASSWGSRALEVGRDAGSSENG